MRWHTDTEIRPDGKLKLEHTDGTGVLKVGNGLTRLCIYKLTIYFDAEKEKRLPDLPKESTFGVGEWHLHITPKNDASPQEAAEPSRVRPKPGSGGAKVTKPQPESTSVTLWLFCAY